MTQITPTELELLQQTDVMGNTVDAEQVALENKIQNLELERINLRVTPVTFDKLLRLAEQKNQSIEDYCLSVLQEKLEENIGKPTISGPSFLTGKEVKKITGPSWTQLPN